MTSRVQQLEAVGLQCQCSRKSRDRRTAGDRSGGDGRDTARAQQHPSLPKPQQVAGRFRSSRSAQEIGHRSAEFANRPRRYPRPARPVIRARAAGTSPAHLRRVLRHSRPLCSRPHVRHVARMADPAVTMAAAAPSRHVLVAAVRPAPVPPLPAGGGPSSGRRRSGWRRSGRHAPPSARQPRPAAGRSLLSVRAEGGAQSVGGLNPKPEATTEPSNRSQLINELRERPLSSPDRPAGSSQVRSPAVHAVTLLDRAVSQP